MQFRIYSPDTVSLNDIKVGEHANFMYNDKFRQGRIEKIAPTYITLEIEPGSFKNFTWRKIQSNIRVDSGI